MKVKYQKICIFIFAYSASTGSVQAGSMHRLVCFVVYFLCFVV